jgi:hypothetical protein
VDVATAVALDPSGNIYVTGTTLSTNFPVTGGAFQTVNQGSYDGFVTKMDSLGTTMLYSTYLGGEGSDQSSSIAVGADGTAQSGHVLHAAPLLTRCVSIPHNVLAVAFDSPRCWHVLINVQTSERLNLGQIQGFLDGSGEVGFNGPNREKVYGRGIAPPGSFWMRQHCPQETHAQMWNNGLLAELLKEFLYREGCNSVWWSGHASA